jgi:hypothetical protein
MVVGDTAIGAENIQIRIAKLKSMENKQYKK